MQQQQRPGQVQSFHWGTMIPQVTGHSQKQEQIRGIERSEEDPGIFDNSVNN